MKDYGKIVIWADYFNSTLSRMDGRRVRVDSAVKDPVLDELVEACKILGYKVDVSQAHYPKRMRRQSGFVSLEKKKPKVQVIREVARTLREVRARLGADQK